MNGAITHKPTPVYLINDFSQRDMITSELDTSVFFSQMNGLQGSERRNMPPNHAKVVIGGKQSPTSAHAKCTMPNENHSILWDGPVTQTQECNTE